MGIILTDAKIRKTVGRDRDYKLPDLGGLHLYVTKTGHRSCRFKSRFEARSAG